MKILMITDYYMPHVGGIEVLVREIAERLASIGHDITVITIKLPNTKDFEILNSVKIHRIRVPKKNDRYWFNSLISILLILKLSNDCDIIHATSLVNILPAWVASRVFRKKLVVTVHEIFNGLWLNFDELSWFSRVANKQLEKLLISLPCDKYICVSRYTKNCLRFMGIEDCKLKLIYNGVDYDFFNPHNANSIDVRKNLNLNRNFVYIYFGRPGFSKGVEYLIKAVSLISAKIPNSKLLLILSREPSKGYAKIIKLISELDIKDSIILLDSVPRKILPCYILASDCVVIPSISEGFGFSAAEAYAMGKPIVATDVASLPEVVSGTYVLVEPKNPHAISEGVERVHNGDVSIKNNEFFEWDKCVCEYLRVYEELAYGK